MARILIVDDEPDLLSILSEELVKRGYQADAAFSGEEAIEKLKENRPDLVLLDIRMPGMGGLEALKRIREIGPDIGVIVVTAVRDARLAKEALTLGAYDYVMKPVDFTHLEMVMTAKLIRMGRQGISFRRWARCLLLWSMTPMAAVMQRD